jgi:hypothetical protein
VKSRRRKKQGWSNPALDEDWQHGYPQEFQDFELKENQNVILDALGMATDIRRAFTVDNSGWKGGVNGCKS